MLHGAGGQLGCRNRIAVNGDDMVARAGEAINHAAAQPAGAAGN
ncbi:hypothetical protein GCM10009589_22240 [Arthrobacter pascens]